MIENRSSLTLLAEQIRSLESSSSSEVLRFSSGLSVLDKLIPGGGFRQGSIIEWLTHATGAGGWSLALMLARCGCHQSGMLAVIDRHHEFHSLPLLRSGWERHRLLLVRPKTDKDELWAWEHILKCRAASVVIGDLERASDRSLRRLQLAAESGLSLGLLLRPGSAQREPSWADARILVEPLSSSHFARPPDSGTRYLRLTLLYARGGMAERSTEVSWHEETSTLSLASRLGHSAETRRSAN